MSRPIPMKSRAVLDVTQEQIPRLFSERSTEGRTSGHTYTTRWSPIMFAVICLVGQIRQVRENMK